MNSHDETPEAFLAKLGQALKACEGVDSELAEIVVNHILAPSTAQDRLEQAMMAINALAVSRSTPPQE
jgi:hypothetical protein